MTFSHFWMRPSLEEGKRLTSEIFFLFSRGFLKQPSSPVVWVAFKKELTCRPGSMRATWPAQGNLTPSDLTSSWPGESWGTSVYASILQQNDKILCNLSGCIISCCRTGLRAFTGTTVVFFTPLGFFSLVVDTGLGNSSMNFEIKHILYGPILLIALSMNLKVTCCCAGLRPTGRRSCSCSWLLP